MILTQRDSAVSVIDASENRELRDQLMPKLDANEIFTTVGIAQLTTSRQDRAPRCSPRRRDGFILNGIVPWCTGAAKADVIVAGALLEDGQQILFALPSDSPGVTIDPPLPLVALRATLTSEIHLQNVPLPHRQILRGPVENVLSGRKKTLPAGQAFLALGHCKNALHLIAAHDSPRARAMHERFESQLQIALESLLEISQENACAPTAPRTCEQLQQARTPHDPFRRHTLQRHRTARVASRAASRARGDVSAGVVVSRSCDRLHRRSAGRMSS